MEANRTPVSRKQLVYEALRDRILSLELESNAAIYENEVALDLGVSRTPVREALAALEREGLVRIVPGKGAFVSPTSAQRVVESYEVREVLEGLAARLAVGRVQREEFRPLREIFQACAEGRPVDNQQVLAAASRFHQLIADHCGNSQLTQLMRQMSDQVRRLRAVTAHRTARLAERSREYLEIMQAIEDNEPALAETLMRHHLKLLRKNAANLLGQQPKSTDLLVDDY